MRYNQIISEMAARKEKLGLTDSKIARLSGVSQPVVNRILKGRHKTARLDQIIAIADVLDLRITIREMADAMDLRRKQAEKKADQIIRMVQATSALEGQGLDKKTLEDMREQTVIELLAGPDSVLWEE